MSMTKKRPYQTLDTEIRTAGQAFKLVTKLSIFDIKAKDIQLGPVNTIGEPQQLAQNI